MLEVKNNTPFSTKLIPALDRHGNNYAVTIIKGTFDIRDRVSTLVVADEQVSPQLADVFYGEAGASSIRYEADLAWVKRGADIVVNGHAYAPAGHQVQKLEATLQVGNHKHRVSVFGDRFWEKSGLRWQCSTPRRFGRMALSYENAYGGSVSGNDDQSSLYCFAHNPVGKGYVGTKGEGLKEGLPLPNLESPTHLIQHWDDRPMPAGFGFVGRSWQPRLGFAGTYDQQWERERMPLLPIDFDDRYHNSAHPSLVLPQGLAGDEQVVATNLCESGSMAFALPGFYFRVRASIKGKTADFLPAMDTVLIEPDDNRVVLTWRAAIPCAKQFLYVDDVTVDWSTR